MLDFGFYNMDCMEGMKQFPDKYFDLAIVDPPYGISVTSQHVVKDGTHMHGSKERPFAGVTMRDGKRQGCAKVKIYHPFDDTSIPEKEYFDELFRISKRQIIWGGNFFLDYLGSAKCILVWDKGRRNLDQADCEIAWTSLKDSPRIIEYKWNGMLQQNMKNKEIRIHPTQKPVELYEILLTKYAKEGDKILDTHVGSASSLIACHNTGHKFVGFELDKYYYELAMKRYKAETAQLSLFDMEK